MRADTLTAVMLVTACLLSPAAAHTAETNKEPIHIRADFMQLDVTDGSSEYRGNVLIEKGAIRLSGDTVRIQKNDGEPSRISITGKPARYTQPGGDKPTTAQSDLMLFDVDSEILTLKNRARLQQQDQLIESDFIRFDTRKQVLLAGSDRKQNNTGKQRVNIILSPGTTNNP